MFELSVAFKYLIPRWRQLSVSIISLISVFVIALVVWLIVVFFSVTQGLESSWIKKMIALTAPIRITPTKHYYESYYALIDEVSSESGYSSKSIREKMLSPSVDPYDPTFDEELPESFPLPDLNSEGALKDVVQLAFQAIKKVPNTLASDYEMGAARLELKSHSTKKNLAQNLYFSSFDSTNHYLTRSLVKARKEDAQNLTRHHISQKKLSNHCKNTWN